MIYIRPVSDLRNKYPEIEELVLKEEAAVYLTKNGYGSMVVLSLDKYSEMLNMVSEDRILLSKFGTDDIVKALEEAEVEANSPDVKYYSHEEMKQMTRRIIDGE